MLYGSDRKHVRESFALHADDINPAFAYGRRNDEEEDEFILAFFLHCSKKQLEYLSSLVEPGEEEVLVSFSRERKTEKGISVSELSIEEKSGWDFSRPWKAYRLCTSWDELRDVPQNVISVVYT